MRVSRRRAGTDTTDSDNFAIPGTESQRAVEQLRENLPAYGGAQTQITFAAPEGRAVTDPGFAGSIDQAVARRNTIPDVAAAAGPAQTRQVSPDGRVGLGTVQWEAPIGEVSDPGNTASNIDTSDKLAAALPVFVVVVVGLAFLLLTVAFRAALVPLTSIAGFLLSVFAALGVQVAIFQWGWGADLLGITPGETISFLPIIVLAIIFGLSSDYEVFVVSRIKEELGGVDGSSKDAALAAVRAGVGLSARVVTAAALIMFGVFIAFLAGGDPIIKSVGLTLAVGVFLDAFLVRLTLIPAVMAMLRDKMWMHSR